MLSSRAVGTETSWERTHVFLEIPRCCGGSSSTSKIASRSTCSYVRFLRLGRVAIHVGVVFSFGNVRLAGGSKEEDAAPAEPPAEDEAASWLEGLASGRAFLANPVVAPVIGHSCVTELPFLHLCSWQLPFPCCSYERCSFVAELSLKTCACSGVVPVAPPLVALEVDAYAWPNSFS